MLKQVLAPRKASRKEAWKLAVAISCKNLFDALFDSNVPPLLDRVGDDKSFPMILELQIALAAICAWHADPREFMCRSRFNVDQ